MTLIRFLTVVEGAVIGLDDTPLLEGPSEEYGVKSLDDESVVAVSGTAMTADGLAWKYEIDDEAPVPIYRYYVKAFYGGKTYYVPRTTEYVNSSCLVIGRYTDSREIEDQFGIDNAHKWLGIDNHDEPADYAMRLYKFIRDAEEEVDDALRDGGCSIPFDADAIPRTVSRVACALAGVRAYEARGVSDVDSQQRPTHRLLFQMRWAADQLARIRGGSMRLSVDDAVRYPEVLVEDVSPSDDAGVF